MTILVSVIDKQKNGVVMASDSMVSMGFHSCPTDALKIVDFKFMQLSSCGSLRGINIIEGNFNPPHIGWDEDVYQYMLKKFIPCIMDAFRVCGALENLDGVLTGPNNFIVAIDGRIFAVGSDFSVLEYKDFAADGCGYEYAYGSLYSTRHIQDAQERASIAILAASEFDKGCGRTVSSIFVPELNREEVLAKFEACAAELNKGIKKKADRFSAEDVYEIGMSFNGELILPDTIVVEKKKTEDGLH